MYTCTCNAHCTCIHVYTCTCIYSVHVHCMHVYTCSYMYMYIVYTCTLCAKCSFAPSADFDAQTLDPHFAQLITLCTCMYIRVPWLVHVHVLCGVYIYTYNVLPIYSNGICRCDSMPCACFNFRHYQSLTSNSTELQVSYDMHTHTYYAHKRTHTNAHKHTLISPSLLSTHVHVHVHVHCIYFYTCTVYMLCAKFGFGPS